MTNIDRVGNASTPSPDSNFNLGEESTSSPLIAVMPDVSYLQFFVAGTPHRLVFLYRTMSQTQQHEDHVDLSDIRWKMLVACDICR